MKDAPSCGSSRKDQLLLGRPVCQHSFRQLLGIGPQRFLRLKQASITDEVLPIDGRRRPRRHDGTNVESMRKRGLIVDFLEEIYNTMSEPMPEAYAKGQSDPDQPDYLMPQMRFRRNRGKNPGKQSREKGLSKHVPLHKTPVRLLPPGSFTEYLNMLREKHPSEKFTLKLFCNVSWRVMRYFLKLFQLHTDSAFPGPPFCRSGDRPIQRWPFAVCLSMRNAAHAAGTK